MRLVGAEEFVELRRFDVGAGQQGVRLPTVMDLVLEEVRQDARHRFVLHTDAALDANGAIESSCASLQIRTASEG